MQIIVNFRRLKMITGLLCSSLFLILWPSSYSLAKENRTSVGTLKIDEKSAIIITSSPSLQERKLSTIYLEIKADSPEQLKKIIPLSFDADMPEHYHGMMVKATAPDLLKDEKTPTYQIRGVKLHMPGQWRIIVKVKVDEQEKELVLPYEVKI